MINRLTIAATAAVLASGIAAAQTTGTPPSGLGDAMAPVSPTSPGLSQPATGITPPIGAATSGMAGDGRAEGRVGTLAPGATTNPGVTGTTGTMPTTSGTTPTTPTTNPPPR